MKFFRLNFSLIILTALLTVKAYGDEQIRLFDANGSPVADYDLIVHSLENKTVIMGDGRVFRLGEALGGQVNNLTYAIADEPGFALRIAQRGVSISSLDSIINGHAILKLSDQPVVNIREAHYGQYIVQEHVSMATEELFILTGEPVETVRMRLDYFIEAYPNLTHEVRDYYLKKLDLFIERTAPFLRYGDGGFDQIIFDQKAGEWRLLDYSSKHVLWDRAAPLSENILSTAFFKYRIEHPEEMTHVSEIENRMQRIVAQTRGDLFFKPFVMPSEYTSLTGIEAIQQANQVYVGETAISQAEREFYGRQVSDYLMRQNAKGNPLDSFSTAARVRRLITLEGITGPDLTTTQVELDILFREARNNMNPLEKAIYNQALDLGLDKVSFTYNPTDPQSTGLSFDSEGRVTQIRIGGAISTFRQKLIGELYKFNRYNSIDSLGVSDSPFNIIAKGQDSLVHKFVLEVEAQAASLYKPNMNEADLLRQSIEKAQLKLGVTLENVFESVGSKDLLRLVKENPAAVFGSLLSSVTMSQNKPITLANHPLIRENVRAIASTISSGKQRVTLVIDRINSTGNIRLTPEQMSRSYPRLAVNLENLSVVSRGSIGAVTKLGDVGLIVGAGLSLFAGAAAADEVRRAGGTTLEQTAIFVNDTGKSAGGFLIDMLIHYPEIAAAFKFQVIAPLATIRPTIDFGRPFADSGAEGVQQIFSGAWQNTIGGGNPIPYTTALNLYLSKRQEARNYEKRWNEYNSRFESLTDAERKEFLDLEASWRENIQETRAFIKDANDWVGKKFQTQFQEKLERYQLPQPPDNFPELQKYMNNIDRFKNAIGELMGSSTSSANQNGIGLEKAVNIISNAWNTPGTEFINMRTGINTNGQFFIQGTNGSQIILDAPQGAINSSEMTNDTKSVLGVLVDGNQNLSSRIFDPFVGYKNINFSAGTIDLGYGDIQFTGASFSDFKDQVEFKTPDYSADEGTYSWTEEDNLNFESMNLNLTDSWTNWDNQSYDSYYYNSSDSSLFDDWIDWFDW